MDFWSSIRSAVVNQGTSLIDSALPQGDTQDLPENSLPTQESAPEKTAPAGSSAGVKTAPDRTLLYVGVGAAAFLLVVVVVVAKS